MDEYTKLHLLAYFKTHTDEYDLIELNRIIGISFDQFMELMDSVVDEGLVEYSNYKLTLTFKGRMRLLHSQMENYREIDNIENLFFDNKWDINTPYLTKGFSKKKWRDS